MDNKRESLIQNMLYSAFSNAVVMIVPVLTILVLPKILSVEEYGLWQLFLFYLSYAGFFHFGWEDGIYLRYVGVIYEELSKPTIKGQIVFILLIQILLGICIIIGSFLSELDKYLHYIFFMIGIILVLVNGNNLFSIIFQMTNRIKDYAKIITLEPLAFMSLAIGALVCGWHDATALILSKALSLFFVCILSVYLLRDIWRVRVPEFSSILLEAKDNITVGSRLMIANIASMLVVGIVRFGISQGWDVATFGKVSLTLSISNFLLVFINAVSVVLLPVLSHITNERRLLLYHSGRMILTAGMMVLLLAYYPLYGILSLWLPQYTDSLAYMAILFPICLTESRMSLLINTYLKVMRQEKLMMRINLMSVLFSFVVTLFCVVVLHDLLACVFSIVIILSFKAYWAEWNLCRLWDESAWHNITIDFFMIGTFVFCSCYWNGWTGMIGYSIVLFFYIFSQRKALYIAYDNIR